jgi:trans-aconitate 2-methyltransferase
LKPGGRFVAEFGGRGNIRTIQSAMIKASRQLGFEPAESPWYYPSIADYAQILEGAGLETTFATLFDRPTALHGQDGMRDWVKMFCGAYLNQAPAEQQELFFSRIEAEVRPMLYRDGIWMADYRRLRVVALRCPGGTSR